VGAGAGGEEEGEEAQAVPLQLEDEGILQEQGWVYPPRVCLLLSMSNDPQDTNSRVGWVELDEGDTIFKCISVLLSRAAAVPPSTAPENTGPGGISSTQGAGGSATPHTSAGVRAGEGARP
ncbi:unnamed protein product, partial [Discosporangium mesarthrocarpum]